MSFYLCGVRELSTPYNLTYYKLKKTNMKKSISFLVSRILSRISAIEEISNSNEITSNERAFLTGRISAFCSVLRMINNIYHY